MGRRRPSDLDARGARLWRNLSSEIEDDRADLLIEACRTVDLVERIDRELSGALVVEGSQGQARAHPLLSQRSAALDDLRRLLRALE